MAGMPGIVIRVAADTRDAIQGLNKVDRALGKTAGGWKRFGAVATAGAAAAAAGLAIVADAVVDAVKAAAEEDKELATLHNTIENLGFKESAEEIDAWVDATARATTQTDSDLRPALAQMLTVTKDVTQAQYLLGVAINLAATKQIPLAAAAAAVAKAASGQLTALKKLVPGVKSVQDLARVVAGADAAAFATLEEKVKGAGEALDEFREAGGHGFIESLGDTTGGVTDLTNQLYDLQPAAESAGSGLGLFVKGVATAAGYTTDFIDTIRSNPIGETLTDSIGNTLIGPFGQLGKLIENTTTDLQTHAAAVDAVAASYDRMAAAALTAAATVDPGDARYMQTARGEMYRNLSHQRFRAAQLAKHQAADAAKRKAKRDELKADRAAAAKKARADALAARRASARLGRSVNGGHGVQGTVCA